MKFKALITAGIAVLTLIAGVGLQAHSASANAPGQDHAWNVHVSTTAAGAGVHPDVTVKLNLCTDNTGLPGPAHECAASAPATPFFDQATAQFKGIVMGAQPIGARVGSITFDIQTNGGVMGGDGQPAACGSVIGHLAPPTTDIWNGNKAGTVVSMDPSGTPGFSIDQLDDATQANAGAPQGDGWPDGIRETPVVQGSVLTFAGIPSVALIARGYSVSVIAFGASQTTVSFLTVGTGSNPGTADAIANITLLGNPFGAANISAQSTTTCPPFYSEVLTLGTSLPSLGSKAINTTVLPDFSPAAAGATNMTYCTSGCTAGYSYDILLSSIGDDDADGINNSADDCPTVPDPGQAEFAGIGIACNAGQGYDNNNAGALAALSGCVLATTCTDIDGDGFLNASDNCPFVANPTQKNNDSDGRGDACEGNGTDPTVSFNNPQAVVKGDGTGYFNGKDPGMVTSGHLDDQSDICLAPIVLGGPLDLTTACLAHGAGDSQPGGGLAWQDSNNDGIPDFLCQGACASGTVTRDHKADANKDGYSDADEGTPANCGAASCNSILTKGTGETNSCRSAGRLCGSGAATTWDPLVQARNGLAATGTGCLTTLDTTTALKTTKLAQSDIDLDGAVSILDISKVAGWFGNAVGAGNDPRWEGNMDGDGTISILDLSAMAANFGRGVDPSKPNPGCQIQ